MVKEYSISASLEDYLEGIFIIKEKRGVVRVKDLAKRLKVKASSVIEALERLKQRDLIIHEYYGYVELTQEGMNLAKELYYRHMMLKKFFTQILGLPNNIAEEDACKIEHFLSKETLNRIVKFISFIETCPEERPEWLNNFHYFVEHNKRPEICITKVLKDSNGLIKLSDLEVGKKGKVIKILDTGVLKRRLLDMGFVIGECVEVKKIAPLGSPVDVLVKGTHVSLRKEEAEVIVIELM